MELQLNGSKSKKVEISDDVFSCVYNEALIHQVVTAYLAAGRAGTQAQKTRSEVSGGGCKPFRQKGGGRARAGTIRSPLWRKGGVVFAAKPRSYEQKVNKKMYRGAVRSILSELIRTDRMMIVESFSLDQPKTKELLTKLNDMGAGNDVLIISNDINENLYLAARNLSGVDVRDAYAVDPVALVGMDKVIITVDALKKLEDQLK